MPEERQQGYQSNRNNLRQGNYQQDRSIIDNIKRTFQENSLENLSAETIVKHAEELGWYLKNIGLKTTQIRKFLDGVRRLDNTFENGKNFNKDTVILLRPKLAYTAGRHRQVQPLFEVLDPAIKSGSSSYKNFKKLLSFIEAIVAYHKFYGGQD